jgi:hypothetical protein
MIEFFSSVDGLTESFPIIKHSKELPKWINLAREDFKQQQESELTKSQHIFKCPGIFHVFSLGFLVTSWHDFEITCTDRGLNWTIPDKMMNVLLERDVIQLQSGDGIAKYIPKRPWSIPHIIKLNTPWHVIAPKNVKFLMLPLPYAEEMDFECCPGILDPGYSSEINIQLYWNKIRGNRVVKAGTPLAYLIPLTEKNYNFVVRDKNEKDEKWLKKRKYLNFFSFVFGRNKVKDSYLKHYGDKEYRIRNIL